MRTKKGLPNYIESRHHILTQLDTYHINVFFNSSSLMEFYLIGKFIRDPEIDNNEFIGFKNSAFFRPLRLILHQRISFFSHRIIISFKIVPQIFKKLVRLGNIVFEIPANGPI